MARILVADDTAFMRTMLCKILENGGHEIVAEVSDGQDAVEAYLKTRPDLVLMDVIMPRMDGIMALKTIISVHKEAKIIVVTAIQSVEMAKFAFKSGAAGYIMKPFQQKVLLKEIDNVLGIIHTQK